MSAAAHHTGSGLHSSKPPRSNGDTHAQVLVVCVCVSVGVFVVGVWVYG
jgi:hypothetical protein